MKRRTLLAAAVSLVPFASSAQSGYPSMPIKLVVGFAPGGGSDAMARVIGQRLAQQMGQPVVIDNKPGANGNIGAEYAAKLAPDGHALLLISLSQAINVSLYTKLGYNLVKDFAPVAMLGEVPNSVVVHPSLGVNTIAELVALSKQRPGAISYASSGNGSPEHLAAEQFKFRTGTNLLHVPYKGSGASVVDLVAGHVPVGFNTLPSVLPHIKAGKLKLLAVTTAKRSPTNPDVPTLAESGLTGFDISTWYALVTPQGTPTARIDRLNAAVAAAVRDPEVKDRLSALGVDVRTSTPGELAAHIKSEIEVFRKVVERTGTRLDG